MKLYTLKHGLLLCSCLLAFTCGCSTPLVYKPSYDLGAVYRMELPNHIETLERFPRSAAHAVNGINLHVNERQNGNIKEMFDLKKGAVEYGVFLFYTDAAAKHWYEGQKAFQSNDIPIFNETSTNEMNTCVFYVEQPRADPEGGSVPMGFYISRALLRFKNIFVRVWIRQDKPQTDTLTPALKDMARMLNAAIATTNHGATGP